MHSNFQLIKVLEDNQTLPNWFDLNTPALRPPSILIEQKSWFVCWLLFFVLFFGSAREIIFPVLHNSTGNADSNCSREVTSVSLSHGHPCMWFRSPSAGSGVWKSQTLYNCRLIWLLHKWPSQTKYLKIQNKIRSKYHHEHIHWLKLEKKNKQKREKKEEEKIN